MFGQLGKTIYLKKKVTGQQLFSTQKKWLAGLANHPSNPTITKVIGKTKIFINKSTKSYIINNFQPTKILFQYNKLKS